jgi:hypothetical protein
MMTDSGKERDSADVFILPSVGGAGRIYRGGRTLMGGVKLFALRTLGSSALACRFYN